MNNGKAIKIKGVNKEYLKKDSSHSGFLNKFRTNNSGQSFYALKEINLEINKGEVIGIIGSNGAGKSTLLKILAEVTPPTTGSIEIYGKVASILEIGIGFQPELSGYENIFLSGKLYGLTKKQLMLKLDKIIEMFGFPDFIDTEVKHYSSGMYMRLAFSIIVNIEADIYLFDEVLSVGDKAFQSRALKEIEKLKESQATICIVTHTPKVIYPMCDNMILLDKGQNIFFGDPNSAIIEYRKVSGLRSGETVKGSTNLDSDELSILKRCFIDLKNASFDLTSYAIYNESVNDKHISGNKKINVELKFDYFSCEDFRIMLLIQDNYGTAIVTHFVNIAKSEEKKSSTVRILIPENSFNEAKFTFDILIVDSRDKIIIGYRNLSELEIINEENKTSKLLGYVNLCIENIF